MKKSYLFVLMIFAAFLANAQPPTAAPVPGARSASNVICVFSGAYTAIAGTNFNPSWGQSTVASEIFVGGNATKSYTTMNYQGIEFANAIDASNMDSLHFDIWTPDCTSFDMFLINTTPTTVEQAVTITPTISGWKSVNIALSQYSNIALHNILQMKLVATPFGTSSVYLDNIYFYKSSKTPTISGFTVLTKTLGSAPFTITAPTSNSTGAFTYTSSNTSVATISGNTVTVTGVGNTYIKATQAAAGTYGVGNISTTFVVTTGLPTVPTAAATTPTKPSANVISLFSNAYTNKTVDTWSASWDQADSATVQIAGNDTKKYTNLNYAGVEFTSSTINVTNMQYYHVDVWTPNATSFHVKLVDFGANGVFGGGDDVEHEYTCTPPAFSTWVGYDIPLSDFTNLTTKAHLAQMLFISSASTVYIDNVYFYKNIVSPVKLTDFKATKSGNSVLLNWKTASESNNKGFYIERSVNGTEWTAIQFVKGVGTTASLSSYAATDKNSVKGVNYYRLNQVDFDNTHTYSTSVSVKFSETNIGFSFYPNPAKNNLLVSLDKIENNNATLVLVNANGQLLKSRSVKNQNSNSTVSFDISSLAPGVYYLQLKDGSVGKVSKVVIQ